MTDQEKAEYIVHKMYDNDPFSQLLGINIEELQPGKCILSLKVEEKMLNGFAIAHGGIAYSLADSALAFASNSYGRICVSVETSISHIISVKENDILRAETVEIDLRNKIGIYQINITNQKKEKVAFFKGTVYRTEKEWE